jgi:predicted hotdog family 3-hydroxylacyl-ACP dehydratase
MTTDRHVLASLIPHHGAMCLLDRVLHWSETEIVCRAVSHRDPANPLCHDRVLPAHTGIEYGAQAMAAHGALTGGMTAGAIGYLAAARDVQLQVRRLDDIADELEVRCEKLLAEGGRLLYRFAVCAGGRELVDGRLTVVLRGERA